MYFSNHSTDYNFRFNNFQSSVGSSRQFWGGWLIATSVKLSTWKNWSLCFFWSWQRKFFSIQYFFSQSIQLCKWRLSVCAGPGPGLCADVRGRPDSTVTGALTGHPRSTDSHQRGDGQTWTTGGNHSSGTAPFCRRVHALLGEGHVYRHARAAVIDWEIRGNKVS